MARILITSGPTRQYLDPVRYLTNASSGQMGAALAQTAVDAGHDVIVVSGPVQVTYPSGIRLLAVETTPQMLEACRVEFPRCAGLIAAAAPCDFQPVRLAAEKIAKTGQKVTLEFTETPDILQSLGRDKRTDQWIVGFALETTDPHSRAFRKLQQKRCDLMVLNGPAAINAQSIAVEIMDATGQVVISLHGSKPDVAARLMAEIQQRLIRG